MRGIVGLEAVQVVVSGGEKRSEKTNKAALQAKQEMTVRGGSLIVDLGLQTHQTIIFIMFR